MRRNLSFILLAVLIISCGPSGATRAERQSAEKSEAIADGILKLRTLNDQDLVRAYEALKDAEHGFRDDEVHLAQIFSKKGFIRFLQKNYGEALNILRESLKLDPKLQAPYVLITRIFNQRREYSFTIGWALKGLERHPNQVELLINAGIAYYHQKNYRQSEDYLQRAITAGAGGDYLRNIRIMLVNIRKLMQSDTGAANLQEYLLKNILTFDEIAKLVDLILPVREIVQKRLMQNSTSSDSYNLMETLKIYNRREFLRDKYVSRGDFAYILCRLVEFFKNSSLNVSGSYTDNPGIPDLKKDYYAFPHVLYVIEQNFIQLLEDGRFGTLSNLNGEVSIKALKILKERFGQ